MRKRIVVIALGLVCALPIVCQEMAPPRVGVSIFKVKPGMMGRWMELGAKLQMPVMDRLMEQEAVMAYGVSADILHRPGEPNVTVWYAVPNYEALQKVDEGISTVIRENPAEAAALLETQDFEMHSDHVMRALEHGGKPAPAGSMPYTYINQMKVRDGQDEAFLKAFQKNSKPMLDQLAADGAIHVWGLYAEEMHGNDPGYRWLVIDMPGLGAIDKAIAAMNAAEAKKSVKERAADETEFRRTSDFSAHRDYIQRALVYKTR